MSTVRWILFAGLVVAVAWSIGIAGRRYVRGLSLVIRGGNLQGVARTLAEFDTLPIGERIVTIPLRPGHMRARIYAPQTGARQTVLLVSGLHPAGIDEPRLVALARELARSDVAVVTPEISELGRFEITPLLTDRIEQAAHWLATESGVTNDGRIGMMGVSFSGGLSIVAAGRPSLKDRLLYVFSFGGHDDLRRVLEYFCAGLDAESFEVLPRPPGVEAIRHAPHDYGVAVVLLNIAEHVVPADQVASLRDGVRRFLWASYLERIDKARAEAEFAALRALARTLPDPSSTLLDYVNNRDVGRLGPRLLPHIAPYVDRPELSPSLSPGPSVPVFLLHGRDDNVIPAAESQHLAARLRDRVKVHLLLTDLISHAEADQPAHLVDVLRLGKFWGDLLDQ
jgi:dienelactone hydrolase